MCFLLFLRMLCQLSDHGVSLVKQVPIDDEETVRKVCEAIVTINNYKSDLKLDSQHSLKSCYSGTVHSSSFELNFKL